MKRSKWFSTFATGFCFRFFCYALGFGVMSHLLAPPKLQAEVVSTTDFLLQSQSSEFSREDLSKYHLT